MTRIVRHLFHREQLQLPPAMTDPFAPPSSIRRKIVERILADFKASLPIYEQMMAVADEINARAGAAEAARLGRIMHAAIRCASDQELTTICSLFALLKCEPVNYYDLRERVSVESTAFRPTSRDELDQNGFRVFCSKLSMDCIDPADRGFVEGIVARREIFSGELLELIDVGHNQGGLDQQQADRLVELCVGLFTRPERALVSIDEYERLRSINKVAAQVLVSNSLAFNHLTPSVASVPEAHDEMKRRGIETIPVWQGPVGRDVILRQTSCLAPAISLKFPESDGTFVQADYQETFVEFEERLQALTPKGRELFEAKFDEGKRAIQLRESDPEYASHYYSVMGEALADFPTEAMELWNQQLAYFTLEVTDRASSEGAKSLAARGINELVNEQLVELIPVQYEDFFGPAATNIFNSNIGLEDVSNVSVAKSDAQTSYEQALGREVVNMYDFYDGIQAESESRIRQELSALAI